MRYLGVDYGSKRIGLALSDEAGTMGFPHAIVANTLRVADEIVALIKKENIGAVVIGDSRDFPAGKIRLRKRRVHLEIKFPNKRTSPSFLNRKFLPAPKRAARPKKK